MKRWQTSRRYFWETAPFFRLLLPQIIVIFCYDRNLLPAVRSSTLISTLFVILLVTILTFLIKKTFSGIGTLRVICVYTTVTIASWLLCHINDIRNQGSWLGNHLDAEVYKAVISAPPVEREQTWKLKVDVISAYAGGKTIPINSTAFLYINKDSTIDLKKGDLIIFPNKWNSIRNAGNPREFDYMRFCNRNQIHYQAFIKNRDILIHTRTNNRSFIDSIHDWAMLTLYQHINDPATLGLLQAMLLGDEINFDRQIRQAYVDTGIIHILAISGGHIILFFQIIRHLFFWLPKKYEFLKYLLSIPLVCFYVLVAGAPVSAVRAAIMFSLMAFGFMLQKDRQSLNQLFATAFFMLLYEPMWLFSIGFQLSFAAVLSLILFYRPLYDSVPLKNKIIKPIWEIAAVSIAAEVLVAPIVIYYFHLLPLTFLLANVIAYLFMSIVLITGLLLIIVSSFGFVAGCLATVIISIVKYVNQVVAFFQRLNPDSFKCLYLSWQELIIIYFIIAGFALFFLKRQYKGLLFGLTASCLLFSLMIINKWQALNQHMFIAYNIRGNNYAEIISGNRYFPVLMGNTIPKDFAIKELHIASRAWKMGTITHTDVILINGQKLLVLDKPIQNDSVMRFNVDYLLLNYPVKEADVMCLQKVFHFKKLIIGSNQKQYLAERLKDSCRKYRIPAHFIASDGAFILK